METTVLSIELRFWCLGFGRQRLSLGLRLEELRAWGVQLADCRRL